MIQKIMILMSCLALVLSFQNCEFTDHHVSSKLQSTSGSGGNGNGYDGKLNLVAPPSMSAGQAVEVRVEGGRAPYHLTSNAIQSTVTRLDENRFLFHLLSSEGMSKVELIAHDSSGESSSRSIRVLGINNWFFNKPTDVQRGENGSLFFIDEGNERIIHLDSRGGLLSEIPTADLPGINRPTSLAYSAVSNMLFVFDRENRSLIKTRPDGSTTKVVHPVVHLQVPEMSCDLGRKLAILANETIAIACDGIPSVLLFSMDGIFKYQTSSVKMTSNERAEFTSVVANSDSQQLLALTRKGTIMRFTSEGALVDKIELNGESSEYLGSVDAVDLDVMDDGSFLVLNAFKKQVLKVTASGLISKKISGPGFADHSFVNLNSISHLGAKTFVVTDVSKNRLSFFDLSGEFLFQVGSSSSSFGAFFQPTRVELDSTGRLAVLDSGNRRLQLYSNLIEFTGSIDSRTLKTGPWWNPRGFSFGRDGRLLIANFSRQRVDVVDLRDESQSYVIGGETKDAVDQTLRFPADAKESANGWIYIADSYNHRIRVWDPKSREFIFSFGAEGRAPGQFKEPVDVEIDDVNDRVYVVDRRNDRIQVFTMRGDFVSEIKPKAFDKGFNLPYDLAFDSSGRMYVADSGNHRIVRLSTNGEVVDSIGSFGSLPGQFNQPRGVTVRDDGLIIVADTENHRVQLFPSLPAATAPAAATAGK